MLMKFSRLFKVLSIFLILYISLSQSKSLIQKFEPDPEVEQEVPIVKGYRDSMINGYTFIFNGEKLPSSFINEDRISSWQTSLIIYKPTIVGNKLKRKVLTMRKLKFLCGVGQFCSIDDFYSKVSPSDLNVSEMRQQVSSLSQIIGGAYSCVADLYDWKNKKYGVVICLNSESKGKFKDLFKNLNPADLKQQQAGQPIASTEKKTYELYLSDGHKTLVKKQVTFESNAIMIEGKKAFNYNFIEPYDGEKCKVKSETTIIHPKLLELNFYNAKCVVKFIYNKVKTFFAYKGENCAQVVNYIQNRMTNSCLLAINGPSNIWKNELNSNPREGIWIGYVFYHRLLDNGGTINPVPIKLSISPKNLDIKDKFGSEIVRLDYKDLKWVCNEDFSCSSYYFKKYLKDFNIENKLRDFEKVEKDAIINWNIQDTNSCIVLQDKDIHFICLTDISEEYNLKKAFANAVDKKLKNSGLEGFITPMLNSSYKVLVAVDSSNRFADIQVTIGDKGIINAETKKFLIEYKLIKEFSGIPCGFEYKNVKVPGQLHEIRPNTCGSVRAEENYVICVKDPSKGYKQLREMINLVRQQCLIIQGFKQPTEITTSLTTSSWTGNVIFMEINNYKYKGSPIIENGTMSVDTDFIKFEGPTLKFKYKTESSNLICGSGTLCSLTQYQDLQSPYYSNGSEDNWFKSEIDFFKEKTKDQLNIYTDCYVYTSTDEYTGASSAIVHCSTDKSQSSNMVAVIPNAVAKKTSLISPNQPEFNNIPKLYSGRSFPALVISGNESTDLSNAVPRENNLKINSSSLTYEPSNDILFKFYDIIFDDKEKYKFGLEETVEGLPKKIKEMGVNEGCCFKAFTQTSNFWFICFSKYPQCVFERVSTVRFIIEALNIEKKNKELRINNNKNKLTMRENEGFNYNLTPQYKTFAPNFNIGDLLQKNFDNSKNGFWSGWGYHMPLTDRKSNKISPVFLEIGKGFVKVKTDETQQPYFQIPMNRFEAVCGDSPCSPKKYLDFYSKINDYSTQNFLEKSVNSCLSQMYRPFRSEACMIMDFTDPHLVSGSSHMFCAMDSLQGESLINSVKTNYYLTLLNLNLDTDIRNIVWDVDKFNASLFIDEKFIKNYNTFHLNKEGLIGTYEDPDNQSSFLSNKTKTFKILYGNISDDMYGNQCGFWYKDLKISTRGQEIGNEVYDDNCCFRFFKSPSNQKIELCIFDYQLRSCIKRSKELMKGIKDGCNNSKNSSMGGLLSSKATSLENVDEFTVNTFDDSRNGVWYGYAYMGPLFQTNIVPSDNPYYVKITTSYISLFSDHKNNNPIETISIDDLNFNCPEFSACKIPSFLKRVSMKPRYASQIGNIKSIIQNYKEKLTDLRQVFDKACSVLETHSNAYILCPYNKNHADHLDIALVRAYILHYECKKIPTVNDSHTGKIWDIVYMIDSIEKKKVYINQKGLVDKATDTVFLDFASLDSDPITHARCAVWIKDIPLSFNFPRRECCFMLSIKGKPVTICLEKKGVCIGDTYKFVKQFWNGCMFGQPILSSDFVPKVDYRNDICPVTRSYSIFSEKEVDQELHQDSYQEIIYSVDKSLYKGWINVYPIEIDKELPVVTKTVYGILSPESFKFYENSTDTSKPSLEVRPDMLSFTCGGSLPCFPNQFISNYTQKFKPELSYYNTILKSRINQYEGGRENGCAVLEYNVNGNNNYMSVCPHFINSRSENSTLQKQLDDSTFINGRAILSSHYGKYLRQIIFDSYAKATKFTSQIDLPKFTSPILKVKLTFQQLRATHEHVKITREGLFSGAVKIFEFRDLSNCRMRFNLISAPKDIVQLNKPQCCVRYRGPRYAEYICVDSPHCEVDTYRLAFLMNQNCNLQKKKHDDIFNEFNGGENADTYKLIKNTKVALVVGNIDDLNPKKDLSTDEYKVKFRSIMYKYIKEARDLINESLKQMVDNKLNKLKPGLPDQTPPDDPRLSKDVHEFISRWEGENENYEIAAGKARATQIKNKKTKDTLLTINNTQIIKAKEYKMVISPKLYSVLLVYNDGDNGRVFIELQNKMIKVTKNIKETMSFKSLYFEIDVADLEKL